jgi:hypothetical protein
MDEYIVEIDELQDNAVVLAVPAMHLFVFGRSLEDALSRARTSIGFRLGTGRRYDVAVNFRQDVTDGRRSQNETAA